MATGKKITELAILTTLDPLDLITVVDLSEGANRRMQYSDLLTQIGDEIILADGQGTTANGNSIDLGGSYSGAIGVDGDDDFILNSESASGSSIEMNSMLTGGSTRSEFEVFSQDATIIQDARQTLLTQNVDSNNGEQLGSTAAVRSYAGGSIIDSYSQFSILTTTNNGAINTSFLVSNTIDKADQSVDSIVQVSSSNPDFRGVTYLNDYSSGYTNRSLVDKEYVDSLSVSVGNTNQIPVSNAGSPGTDFDYTDNFSYEDNARLIAKGFANDSVAIGFQSEANSTGDIAIGRGATITSQWGIVMGDSSTVTGSQNMAIGYDATNTASGNALALGNRTEATGTGSLAIGNNSGASSTGSMLLGYNVTPHVNSTANTFELAWDTTTAFKAGLLYGTGMTVNADPDTNLTQAENGVIAYDSTDHEFRAYVNGAWGTLDSGGGDVSKGSSQALGNLAIWNDDTGDLRGSTDVTWLSDTLSVIGTVSSEEYRLSGSAVSQVFGLSTVDASDDKRLQITGAGGAPSQNRGAFITLNGNERAGAGGVLELYAGDGTPGDINFYTGAVGQPVRVSIDSSGDVEIANGLTLSGIPTSNPGGSGIVWNDSGTLKIT